MLAQDQNLRGGAFTADEASGLKTIHLGHANVHYDDIRIELLGFLYCFQAVSSFSGYVELVP